MGNDIKNKSQKGQGKRDINNKRERVNSYYIVVETRKSLCTRAFNFNRSLFLCGESAKLIN